MLSWLKLNLGCLILCLSLQALTNFFHPSIEKAGEKNKMKEKED
uniref:Uncharacterized protein n=1 Tax=Arundo donax TaxID=35708 RepID=A0A0A9HHP2_ARUDO